LGIVVESYGTFSAGAVNPIETSRVDLLIWRNNLTSAIVESVTSVALLADADVLIEELALGGDLTTDTIDVEIVVLGALLAGSAIPLCAAEVVIESYLKSSIVCHQSLHDWGHLSECGCEE
jgi:hypothetical protein